MPTTFVCINVWEHASALETAIRSARASIPDCQVIVVDGAYAEFPWAELDKQPFSTDGTLQTALDLADTLIQKLDPWASEIVKRSAYLIGSTGDLYIQLDADELLEGTWPGLDPTFQIADIPFVRTDMLERPSPLMRVFRHQANLEYRHTHSDLWADTTHVNLLPKYVLSGTQIVHTIGVNDDARTYAKGKYYRWLNEAEKNKRKSIPMKMKPLAPSEKTETLQFLAITRSCYIGKFSMAMAGETREVMAQEADRLCKTFPIDFRILPKPRTTEKSAGVPAPNLIKGDNVVLRTVRYRGTNPTKIHGQKLESGDTVRVNQKLASVLVYTGLFDILEGDKPAASSSA